MSKRIAIAIVVFAAACASTPKKPVEPDAPDEAQPDHDATPGGGGAIAADAVCAKIIELQQQGCPFLADYDLEQAACVDDYEQSKVDNPKETEAVGRCFVDASTCDAVTACVDRALAGGPEREVDRGGAGAEVPDNMLPLRACNEEGYGAVGYPRAEWDKRRGAGAKRFADVPSSQSQPIEVCGVKGEVEWLLAATCADGSSPYKGDWDTAHASRTGSTGNGGRCDAILDVYEAKCPEKTYEVYMDMYVCPRD